MSSSVPYMRVLVLFAAMLSCSAARMKHNRRASACPLKVEISTKGDCMDMTGLVVPTHCCDHLHDCRDKIDEAIAYYNERANSYVHLCDVRQSDVHNGKVVDDTRICSESCQAVELFKESARTLESWEMSAECEREHKYDKLLRLHGLVSNLDVAWATCDPQTESSTTSPPPTESPTTSRAPTESPTTSPAPTESPTTSPAPTESPTTSLAPTESPTTSPPSKMEFYMRNRKCGDGMRRGLHPSRTYMGFANSKEHCAEICRRNAQCQYIFWRTDGGKRECMGCKSAPDRYQGGTVETYRVFK